MAATWTDGNPLVANSGLTGQLMDNSNRKVKTVYWQQPDLSSTSSMIIRKMNASGQIYVNLRAEVSGQSQTIKLDMWFDNIYIDCVPSGSVWLYFH